MHRILSVCDLTEIQTRQKVTRKKSCGVEHLQTKGTHCWHIPIKLLDIFNDIGRWAHFNVKLHFFSSNSGEQARRWTEYVKSAGLAGHVRQRGKFWRDILSGERKLSKMSGDEI